jgi:hypothetical protein
MDQRNVQSVPIIPHKSTREDKFDIKLVLPDTIVVDAGITAPTTQFTILKHVRLERA